MYTINLDRHIFDLDSRIGRKPKDRLSIFKAFVAKAVFNLDSNRSLITYLNSSRHFAAYVAGNIKRTFLRSKFSRVFSLIAEHEICQKIHESMIKVHCKNRIIGHLSRDSTAVESREK